GMLTYSSQTRARIKNGDVKIVCSESTIVCIPLGGIDESWHGICSYLSKLQLKERRKDENERK
ncbi:MAG: hypothetical protein QGG48_08880, partial [Desulfatiglandales bacterium]|nr:hypothetical protein [Desulfatiglandales bacterium]